MGETAAVSREQLMAFNRTIAQWTRLSGSAEERAAAEYVAATLADMGYATTILEHDAYISLPGRAALRVLTPEERAVPCITHSMGVSTPPGGMTAELVYAGSGTAAEYAAAGAAGRVALVEGRATPQHAVAATAAGVVGIICISGPHAHEMCCSPVWGNPSEQTRAELPRVHLLSVHRADGEALRALCRSGRVTVHFEAEVRTGWTRTPIVVADLAPGHAEAEAGRFVLFSGHLDSWYLGAMDNGSANAAMLEVARLLAPRRAELRRGLRLAMWSGHSHGRYSSSAWYADNHWAELAEHCVIHVNIDSVGAQGADTFATNSMPETVALAADAVRAVAGAELHGHRVGRNSDQSFLGIGIPTVLGSVSHQADGSLGWWWHTPHDTLDKIDPERLARDTRIFLHVLERLLTEPVLPLDYVASAADIEAALGELAAAAGDRFDLAPALAAAGRLRELCAALRTAARPEHAAPVNAALMDLGRILIPATYTASGRFAHDPALTVPFLPKLQPVRRLGAMAADDDEAKFLRVSLVRARNELVAALREACRRVEACLAEIGAR
jgi:hypothetical protein